MMYSPFPSIINVPSAALPNSGTKSSASEKRKVSESISSQYWGRPLSVFLFIEANPRLQPKPKIPFPAPELYDIFKEGEAARERENGRGIENEAVPLIGFTENFSSMPFIAPPPFGKEMKGTSMAFDFDLAELVSKNDPFVEFFVPTSELLFLLDGFSGIDHFIIVETETTSLIALG